jgi:hypothetical protein
MNGSRMTTLRGRLITAYARQGTDAGRKTAFRDTEQGGWIWDAGSCGVESCDRGAGEREGCAATGVHGRPLDQDCELGHVN